MNTIAATLRMLTAKVVLFFGIVWREAWEGHRLTIREAAGIVAGGCWRIPPRPGTWGRKEQP